MNDIFSIFMLLLVPGIPLLLAFSALRARLSRSCFFALLPAIFFGTVLVTISAAVPANLSIKIPWLLLGTGLGIDDISRLFLAMSVILWIVVSLYLCRPSMQTVSHRFTTFFLLTMAGNFGIILSTELVAFFTFMTLMGYGFYGLLVDGGGEPVRRAGRIYLFFMILADLVLFEALLIAAAATDDLSFAAVQQAMLVSSSSGLYLSLVLIGFAAKAGVWPLHFWLLPAFRLSRPEVALLIAGVPVAMGLFGALRWLPLGAIHSPDLGLIIKIMGATAMLYALLFAILRAQLKTLPAYIVVFFTGLYTVALGIGLTDPTVWRQYENLALFFIILMLISLSILVAIINWRATKYHYPVVQKKQTNELNLHLESLNQTIIDWFSAMTTGTLLQIRTVWLTTIDNLQQAPVWQKTFWHKTFWFKRWDNSECFLHDWVIAITLFLLLSIVVALISASLWIW